MGPHRHGAVRVDLGRDDLLGHSIGVPSSAGGRPGVSSKATGAERSTASAPGKPHQASVLGQPGRDVGDRAPRTLDDDLHLHGSGGRARAGSAWSASRAAGGVGDLGDDRAQHDRGDVATVRAVDDPPRGGHRRRRLPGATRSTGSPRRSGCGSRTRVGRRSSLLGRRDRSASPDMMCDADPGCTTAEGRRRHTWGIRSTSRAGSCHRSRSTWSRRDDRAAGRRRGHGDRRSSGRAPTCVTAWRHARCARQQCGAGCATAAPRDGARSDW